MQGIWAPNLEDATCCTTNHRYRLIVFGRRKYVFRISIGAILVCHAFLIKYDQSDSSEAIVYTIDEQTGGLEMSHSLTVSSQVYPGEVGAVRYIKWSPDGCALALSWSSGGFSVWSTFGALLVCSLAWNYGLHVDLTKYNPLCITSMVCYCWQVLFIHVGCVTIICYVFFFFFLKNRNGQWRDTNCGWPIKVN